MIERLNAGQPWEEAHLCTPGGAVGKTGCMRGEALSIQDKENSNKQRLSKKGYTYELSKMQTIKFDDYGENTS